MNKKIIVSICIGIICLIFLLSLYAGAWHYDISLSTKDAPVRKITKVTATIDGNEEMLSLPYSFKGLTARTPVTITMEITPKQGDYLYMKSVYAPLKVYANGDLIYEYGQENTYPHFMQDPATAVKIVSVPNFKDAVQLRMEYLSPVARDVLTVHPVLLGSETSILKSLFGEMGFPFIFSIIQIFIGLFLVLIVVFVVSFERRGIAFLWLGLFSLATGGWTFGECNLTGIFIHNPTILYIAAFSGLFAFPIPLICFGLIVVDFHNKNPLIISALALNSIFCVALLLQLLGFVSLSKSMYLFHILVPLALCFFAGCILYEGIKYQNTSARRFFFPMTVLALFAILEVVNYQLRFTNVLSFFFQIGIIIFIFMMSMIGGIFIKDALLLRVESNSLNLK